MQVPQTVVFSHFSPKSFRLTDFREPHLDTHNNPLGSFWLSEGDSWLDWCKKEGFFIGKYKYKVNVCIDTSQLIVLTRDDVAQFAKKFGRFNNGTWLIQWDRVRDETGKCGVWFRYNMAHITPTIWFKHNWFYGRDVSSVALWSASCIIHISAPQKVALSPRKPQQRRESLRWKMRSVASNYRSES